jgi:AraC family transcriptional regulator
MLCSDDEAILIDAEVALPIATIRLVRFHCTGPADFVVRRNQHLLDLCVTPRPLHARGCYVEAWGAHRFEKLGDIVFVPAGHALHVRSDNGATQGSIACLLHGNEINAWLETEIDWTDQRLHASLDIASITLRHLLRRLATEATHPGPGSRLLTEFLIGQLVIELGRYCDGIGDQPISGGLAAWRLRLIDQRLKDASAPPSLTELAELCRLSIRQLTRGFRASRGHSIGDDVIHNRIEMAKRLLGGDHPIKAVGRSIGFSSSSSFANAFQHATGLTPGQFRQRVLGAKLGTAGKGVKRR